jgi:hypothetical protein
MDLGAVYPELGQNKWIYSEHAIQWNCTAVRHFALSNGDVSNAQSAPIPGQLTLNRTNTSTGSK